jgi:hypothetical protein
VGVALATTAHAQSISLSSTPDGSGTGCIEPPTSFPSVVTLYAFAYTSGLQDGMTGAEFSIRGLDEGTPPAQPYLTQWTPNPAASIALGDPLAAGVNVVFSTCQSSYVVLLGTLTLINQGDTELRQLRIAVRQPPPNPNFDCPLVTHCDVPLFSLECVDGGYAFLNIARDPPPATDPYPADGATGVRCTAPVAHPRVQ